MYIEPELERYIQVNNLKKKSRERVLVDKRSYVYKLLHSRGASKLAIGRYFGKNHATVINGLKAYEIYRTDLNFLQNVDDLLFLFPITGEREAAAKVFNNNRIVVTKLDQEEYKLLQEFKSKSGIVKNADAVKHLIKNNKKLVNG